MKMILIFSQRIEPHHNPKFHERYIPLGCPNALLADTEEYAKENEDWQHGEEEVGEN